MIRTAIFDLGNVLVFFSFPKMLRQMAECTGLCEKSVHTEFFEGTLRSHYETGLISTSGLIDAFRAKAPKRFSNESFCNAISDIFTLNEEIVPVIEGLKAQGIRLVLLSNTSEAHFKYVEKHYAVLKLFDAKVLSYEVGAMKPAAAIYQAALQAARVGAAECFYTDDIEEYVMGARSQGIDAEVFVGVGELKQQLWERSVLR